MSDREDALAHIAEDIMERVGHDVKAKTVTLDDSAALLRVRSHAVSHAGRVGILYGTGTFILATALKVQKRFRLPLAGAMGVMHFAAGLGHKRSDVVVAEFLHCDTELGDYVRAEVERKLPPEHPISRIHQRTEILLRENPNLSRVEARSWVMVGRDQHVTEDGGAPMLRPRVREARALRNRRPAESVDEESREERALETEEESYESVYGKSAYTEEPIKEEHLRSDSQPSTIYGSVRPLEKEHQDVDHVDRWHDPYSFEDDVGSHDSVTQYSEPLDEFSDVSRLELAKQRRKERMRRDRALGRTTRYGNVRVRDTDNFGDSQEEDGKYHSRYESEYTDSRFGGSSSSSTSFEELTDDVEGPTFGRSY